MHCVRRAALRTRALLISLTLAQVVGCGSDPKPPPAACSSGCRAYDARAYALRGKFDWTALKLVATEDVTLALTSGETRVLLDSPTSVKRVHAGSRDLPFQVNAQAATLQVDLSSLSPGTAPVTFTVEYEAPASNALIATRSRDDDPVTSRVVFTDSEPNRGHLWLVEKDDPSDRALWSVELTVPSGEDVIANGSRLSDSSTGAERTVTYALDKPIPTYLMAFAAGELEHTDRNTGSVPLSVWYRRGMVLDPEETLHVVADAMATFVGLIGPYPWPRYSVVLLPFGGGMENVTITFNNETSGQGRVEFNLNAHELAHHWFGDWVTMHGYDDVWVKEGMATLLASEADRARRDLEHRGRLMGIDFLFNPDDAILDPSLHGLEKYTSGPYGRSAALITQMRAKLGEPTFWNRLRQFLSDHALDSATGEEFVRTLLQGDPAVQTVLAALPRLELPSMAVSDLGGGAWSVLLTDPLQILLPGVHFTLVDSAGVAQDVPLATNTPTSVTIPAGGYLAPDELDVHVPFFFQDPGIFQLADAFALQPGAPPAAVAAFETRSAAHQEVALQLTGRLPVGPSGFPAFLAGVDSSPARDFTLLSGCLLLAQDPGWSTVLGPALQSPGTGAFDSSFAVCGTDLPTSLLLPELSQGVAAPTAQNLRRLEYLLSFDYGASGFAPLSQLARTAPTLKMRDQALTRLALQALENYSAVPVAQIPDWKSFFRERLETAGSSTRLRWAWLGVLGLSDASALPDLGAALHRVPLSGANQRQLVCEAYELAGGTGAAWQSFQSAAQPWNTLASAAQAVLGNPALCSGAPVRGGGAPSALRTRTFAPAPQHSAQTHVLENKGRRDPSGGW